MNASVTMTAGPRSSTCDARPPVVLVVDDQETHRTLVKAILHKDGYDVLECPDGMEALERLGTQVVDLVLLDYEMPGMAGDEILTRIRKSKRTRDLPVLILTGHGEPELQTWALDAGANDFIAKPVEPKVLLARIRCLIRTKLLVDASERFEDVLTSLCVAVEAKDPYTQGHSNRVSLNAARLAREMGIDESTEKNVQEAGLIHDIGKLVIDLSFINKPGKLTAEEWTIMKIHPEAGARICAPLVRARPLLPLIRHHHERLDGSGYPDGLVEDQIPLAVRIVAVADVYDALTTRRSYRDGMSHEKAMEILRKEASDGSWDRDVVGTLSGIDPGLPGVARKVTGAW